MISYLLPIDRELADVHIIKIRIVFELAWGPGHTTSAVNSSEVKFKVCRNDNKWFYLSDFDFIGEDHALSVVAVCDHRSCVPTLNLIQFSVLLGLKAFVMRIVNQKEVWRFENSGNQQERFVLHKCRKMLVISPKPYEDYTPAKVGNDVENGKLSQWLPLVFEVTEILQFRVIKNFEELSLKEEVQKSQ